MAIWEKAIINMQKGAQRLAAAAALVSERVKCELAIVRLRIKLDEVQSRIDEQYRLIGRRIVNLKNGDALPKTAEQLVSDEEIAAAVAEIEACKREREDLRQELAQEQAAFKPAEKHEGPGI